MLAAVATVVIGTAVAMEPYFAGDAAMTRMVQSVSSDVFLTALICMVWIWAAARLVSRTA